MIVRANEDEPVPLGLPGGAVVLTTSCLVTLLCFVRLHLHEQLPLPRSLVAMLPDGLDEALQESAATGGSAAAAAIAAVSSGMDVLSKGTECWYERNGERKLATVLSVDYGDDPPFYVIRMDGAERQTVRKYLIQLTMRERVLAALGAEAEAYQVLGTALLTGGPLMIASDCH
jgi:hypothetical protein